MIAKQLSPSIQLPLALLGGWLIGSLGGLIGLGGAEFRLPLLIGVFGFAALSAVILNKTMSLVVVAAALLFRTKAVPLEEVMSHWPIILNLLSGSLLGAWLGAGWAVRMTSKTLYRILAVLLVLIASVLLFGHGYHNQTPLFSGWLQLVAGVASGFAIGVIASLMGVAGGEFLIPTLVLLFGVDIKLAGSLSLAVSLPTMIAGFARYSRDSSFAVISQNRTFVLMMAAGSLLGAWTGGQLLGVVSDSILLPLLAIILLISSIKVWRHH
ncbi:putative membrane protein YfcA [Azomonas agilis]|uniref:Probable membrane transporter protein n=1 Tax=Azomonas agilis TaxID=116849 RepID=A0A562J1W2_9GAMM|nr:sulfite exporter TauE/SafE family protein [Azomonas agilis]TWH77168.1 putative membrane protein YfcA [Azomonas agilis]